MSPKNIVMLVDNKRRDLMVATLIAYHLEQKGIRCHLEPLQAYQSAMAAYKPDLILFNHLTAGHLVRYSQRLAKMGVLVAVLPNEGILYDLNVLEFNAGKHHNGAHIDIFFCWNEVHKAALQKCGFNKAQIEVVGVPRFDFYFSPWSNIFPRRSRKSGEKPNILFCTNFVFSKFKDLPRVHADKFFGQWKMIPSYSDYWSMVETNYASRNQMFGFLDELAKAGKYRVTLRPHPSEDIKVYERWHEQLSPEQKQNICFDRDTNITELILNCDLEVSCETCTTALESWIARKPTIELALQQHPIFYHPELSKITGPCFSPKDLVPMIDQQLTSAVPEEWQSARREHLRKWCHSPNGDSSKRMAEVIADRLATKPPADWSQLKATDHRRALKLKMMQSIGQAYHYDPLLSMKSRIAKGKYAPKVFTYSKSIMPADVRKARQKLEEGLASSQA